MFWALNSPDPYSGHQWEDCLAGRERRRRCRRAEGTEEGDGGHCPTHHYKALPGLNYEYHILSSHDRSCCPSKNILMLLLLQGQGGAPAGDDGGDEDEMDELWASSPLQISAPHLKDTSSSAPWGRAGDCRQDDRQVIKVGSLSQRLYLQNYTLCWYDAVTVSI